MIKFINYRQAVIPIVAGVLLTYLLISSARADTPEAIIIGVHPFLPATTLIERFTPLAEYLSSQLQQPVRISISTNYDEHIRTTGEGQFGIAFLGPASYVQLVKNHGPQRLLARLEVNGKPSFRGAIVTRAGSTLQTLSDLKGHSFAFGDQNSTMSTLVPVWMLKTAGVELADLSKHSNLTNHNDVALGVLLERFDVGAIKGEVYEKYKTRGLQVLAWTPVISEHLFVAGQRLSDQMVEKIRNIMLGLASAPEGHHVLESLKPGLTALVPVTDDNYINLRQIIAELNDKN